jgi:predicted Na+-dependent transporter
MGRGTRRTYSRTMTAAAVITLAIKVSLALTVLAAGMRARPGDHLWLFRRPSLLARTVTSMNVMMPLIAVLMVSILGLSPPVKIALVALSMSPVPPLFPPKVLASRGSASYAVSLLGTAAVLSLVLVPLSAWAIGHLFATPVQIPPRTILELVGPIILLPLLVGGLIRRFAHTFATKSLKPTETLATWLLRLAIVPVFVVSWPAVRDLLGNGTLLAMIVMCLAGLAIGHYVGGPEDDHRVVLALATAVRHPGVAIAIGQAAFPGNDVIRAAVLLSVVVVAFVTMPYVSWAERHDWERRRRSIHLSGRRATVARPAYHGKERRANSARGGDRRR